MGESRKLTEINFRLIQNKVNLGKIQYFVCHGISCHKQLKKIQNHIPILPLIYYYDCTFQSDMHKCVLMLCRM